MYTRREKGFKKTMEEEKEMKETKTWTKTNDYFMGTLCLLLSTIYTTLFGIFIINTIKDQYLGLEFGFNVSTFVIYGSYSLLAIWSFYTSCNHIKSKKKNKME